MPYQEAGLSPELARACARAVHVLHPDGRMERAGRAALTIFEGLGWWFLAPLRWPPFIWFVELGYQLVARNRPFFSRYLFTRRD